jgi:GNAT superfamily N-acetyltransferase
MNTLTVRQAVLSDLDELSALFDHYRVFQGRASDPAAARAFLQQRFDHGESVVFMACEGPSPVGFAQLFPSWSSVALARVFILNDLFVHPSGRRRGVASLLLAAVADYAASLAAVRVTLNVARDNQPGQALYAALGWTQDQHFHMFHHHPASADAGAAVDRDTD